MNVALSHIGKRFNRDWIFRNVTAELTTGRHTALVGANGSGKSTLLQIVSGYLTPSEGTVEWKTDRPISIDQLYKHIAIAAPYVGLYDDFTLLENIRFYAKFKTFRSGLSEPEVAAAMELTPHLNKQLRYFSSGMRQRVKLALAILSHTELLLLDEPCSHFDTTAIAWYQKLLVAHAEGRLILIASNRVEEETFLCGEKLVMEDFKKGG